MIDLILPKFESIRDFYGDGPRPRSPERTSRKPTGCLIYVIRTKRGARLVEQGRESTRPVKTYFPIGNNDDFRWNVEMNTDETSSNNTRRPLFASWTQLPERKKRKERRRKWWEKYVSNWCPLYQRESSLIPDIHIHRLYLTQAPQKPLCYY